MFLRKYSRLFFADICILAHLTLHKYSPHTHYSLPPSTQTHKNTHLYGVGRYPPGKITWENSLCWSVLWELRETIPLDDVSLGKTNNHHFKTSCAASETISVTIL